MLPTGSANGSFAPKADIRLMQVRPVALYIKMLADTSADVRCSSSAKSSWAISQSTRSDRTYCFFPTLRPVTYVRVITYRQTADLVIRKGLRISPQ